MTKENIPKAPFTGEIHIGNATIPCAVLEDGTRLLTQEGFLKALGRAGKAKGGQGASVDKLPAFMGANNLKPFISKELEESTKPIIFLTPSGPKAYGYKAEILSKVCEVFLDADEAGATTSRQGHIVKQANILIRGLAHVGIAALVDEATGYQEIRERQALQKILEKYIKDEYGKWTKRFPDEFYKELFRLKGVPYPPTSGKSPSYVGHWTNEVVYKRLAPGVLTALRERNPRAPSGYRKRKFHQYLTDDIGIPELRRHLDSVIFLMRGCNSWDDFKRRLERAAPKYGDTLPLEMDETA